MITLHDITFGYPEAPLLFEGFNLSFDMGSWTCVTGPGCAGKSTLLRLIKGLLAPQSGRVLLPEGGPARIGYIGGDPVDFIVGVTVEDDVVFGMENLMIPREEMIPRLDGALQEVGLTGFEQRLTHTLSGGEQQKLAIAATLAMGVHTLLIDEALNMLDREAGSQVYGLLSRLNREQGVTVIEATHDMKSIMSADRVIFLSSGRVREDSPPLVFVNSTEGKGRQDMVGGFWSLRTELDTLIKTPSFL